MTKKESAFFVGLLELFTLAVGLSMDAFAVALCKGLAIGKVRWRDCCLVGLWFGGFQALMPALGFLLGAQFRDQIMAYDHWIAFALLALIGLNMVRESFSREEEKASASLSFGAMLPMAVATSIDALAVGVSFAFLQVDVGPAVAFIGCTTFLLSALGVVLGSLLGLRFKRWAELAGGVILTLLGLRILIEHLMGLA